MLVATGYTETRSEYCTCGSNTNKAQVVDLYSNTKCSALPEYPLFLYGAVVGVMERSPLICSGFGKSDESSEISEYQSACYKYQKQSQQWEIHANLKTNGYFAAGSMIGNDLWITGGYQNGVGDLASTEYVKPDGSVIDGPDLPEPNSGHCMVSLHDGTVAILGGQVQHQWLEDYSTLDYLTQIIQLELLTSEPPSVGRTDICQTD